MVSCGLCFLRLAFILSIILTLSADARSWDIAVAIGQQIDFFDKNGTQTEQCEVPDAKSLTGLAYDSVTQTMFMSDKKNENISMYGINLTETKSPYTYTMLNQTNGVKIMAMVFDPVSRTLFWTDSKNHTIMKMQVPLNGSPSPNNAEVLHDLKDYNPYGIALDICNRYMYWSNCKDPAACRIVRSKLDGSEREIVVKTNLYDVYGLAVDHIAGKIYWVDDLEGDNYNIEMSDFDGKERELFLTGTHQEPTYVAVDKEAVYWTDRQSEVVWKMKKTNGMRNKPVEFKPYSASIPDQSPIMGIITWDNIGDIDCKAVLKAQKDRLKSLACTYKEGSEGAFCEVSACHNYCVHGNCVLDAEGSPECVCGNSYAGLRCERNVCHGYCLNNGTCFVSSSGPFCKCENSHQGSRCEYNAAKLNEICSPYCRGSKTTVSSQHSTGENLQSNR